MRDLELVERGTIPISNDNFISLRRSPVFRQMLDQRLLGLRIEGDGAELGAGPYVGSIDLNSDLSLTVGEKVPGAVRALYALAYPREYRLIKASAKYAVPEDGEVTLWLRDSTWRAFLDRAERYIQSGIEKRYKHRERYSQHPRGRILLKKTIERGYSRGKKGRVFHSTPELTRDTWLNRIVKLALLVIYRQTTGERHYRLHRRAGYALYHLVDVPEDLGAATQFLGLRSPLHHVKKSRYRYEVVALSLAVLHGVVMLPQAVRSVGLPFASFLPLERLFERAVFNLFKAAAQRQLGMGVSKYRTESGPAYLFPDRQRCPVYPDVIISINSNPIVLADAKYKIIAEQPSRPDLYQLLAHCRACGAREGWLIGIRDDGTMSETALGTTNDGIKVSVFSVAPNIMREELGAVIGDRLRALVCGTRDADSLESRPLDFLGRPLREGRDDG